LGGEFAVQAVAKGSPAAFAQLKPGDELLAIDGDALVNLPDVRPGSFARLGALQTRIEQTLAAKGELAIALRKDGAERRVVLKGRSVCRSRFELLTSGSEASADGERITISRQYLSLARNDDEVAFLVGHELAHNILRHRAWLDKVGRSNANSRLAERAADRLAVWLMANAGYDVAQAPAFMEHWGERQGSPLFREASHDHWKARQKLVNLELAKIGELRASRPGEALDWRVQFPR
jgi:Zn-dependent protease with chaperone function